MIEHMFGRLKAFRRIATRYDKLARNFLTAVPQLSLDGLIEYRPEAVGEGLLRFARHLSSGSSFYIHRDADLRDWRRLIVAWDWLVQGALETSEVSTDSNDFKISAATRFMNSIYSAVDK